MAHHEGEEQVHHVRVSLARGYEFVASFEDLPDGGPILLDEPPPLGGGRGPNAAALVGTAVGGGAIATADADRESRLFYASLAHCQDVVREVDVD